MIKKNETSWLDQELLKTSSQRDVFLSICHFAVTARENFDCNEDDFVRGAVIAAALVAWSTEDLSSLTHTWDDLWTALDKHVGGYVATEEGLSGRI